jgi:hypothetical protein
MFGLALSVTSRRTRSMGAVSGGGQGLFVWGWLCGLDRFRNLLDKKYGILYNEFEISFPVLISVTKRKR